MAQFSKTIIIVGYIIFFLVTSFSMLKMMILLSVVITILMFLFPPLSAFVPFLVLFLLWRRFTFIKNNFFPILCGLLFYATALPFYFLVSGKWALAIQSPSTIWALSATVAATATLILHLILCLLYARGYKTTAALGIMGGVPLVIVAIILPFLKISDTFFDTHILPEVPTYEHLTEAHNVITEVVDAVSPHLPSMDIMHAPPHVEPGISDAHHLGDTHTQHDPHTTTIHKVGKA